MRFFSHVIQISANQIINQTSQELLQLAATAQQTKDRMFHLQVERLKREFEKSLNRYSMLQKVTIHCYSIFFTTV